MRKFTLIVAAIAFSICANAQGFYAVEKGTPTAGMEVTNVENIKLTWGTGWKANKEGQSGVKIGDNDCTVITQGDANLTGVADGNIMCSAPEVSSLIMASYILMLIKTQPGLRM